MCHNDLWPYFVILMESWWLCPWANRGGIVQVHSGRGIQGGRDGIGFEKLIPGKNEISQIHGSIIWAAVVDVQDRRRFVCQVFVLKVIIISPAAKGQVPE